MGDPNVLGILEVATSPCPAETLTTWNLTALSTCRGSPSPYSQNPQSSSLLKPSNPTAFTHTSLTRVHQPPSIPSQRSRFHLSPLLYKCFSPPQVSMFFLASSENFEITTKWWNLNDSFFVVSLSARFDSPIRFEFFKWRA